VPALEVQQVAEHAQADLVTLDVDARGHEPAARIGAPRERPLVRASHRRLCNGGREVLLGHRQLVILPEASDLAQRRLENAEVDPGQIEARVACGVHDLERTPAVATSDGPEVCPVVLGGIHDCHCRHVVARMRLAAKFLNRRKDRIDNFFFKVGDVDGGGSLNILVNLRV